MQSKPLTLSRGPSVNTEKCVENAGSNRYDLILFASAHLRELRRKHRENPDRYITAVDSLQDIEAGHVKITDYLRKKR
jgi:hypothetical protein